MMNLFLILVLVWIGIVGAIIITIIEAIIKPFMVDNDITITFQTKTGKKTLYVDGYLLYRFKIRKEQA